MKVIIKENAKEIMEGNNLAWNYSGEMDHMPGNTYTVDYTDSDGDYAILARDGDEQSHYFFNPSACIVIEEDQ